MKRNFLVGSVLCAAVTVGAAAQSSAPSGQTPDQGQNTRNQTMTLTGCLQAATIDNRADVDNEEQGGSIFVCERPRRPWAEIWPALAHLDA